MFRKLICLSSFVLVLGLVGNAVGQEVLSVPFVSHFGTDSMNVTAAQEGYHTITVKYIERINDHSGIEITVNGEHLQNAEAVHVVTVPGTACFFFAGQTFPVPTATTGDSANYHRDQTDPNIMPPHIGVYNWRTVSIRATGIWGHPQLSGPDGIGGRDDTHDEYVNLGGISRVMAPLNTLVGVFLTDDPPDPGATPDSLNLFLGDDMTVPELQQAFAIGSSLEYITVPEGATRLFFGHNDGYEWNNNVGSVEVTYEGDVRSRSEVASYPYPADGALNPNTWVSLSWSPGDTAVSHDVYFGENFADVNDGTGETFQGNQVARDFVVGFPGFPYPDGLVPGTTYYWRIDEVEADETTKHKGDVWSLTVPTKKTYNPNPADGATFIDLNVVLSWTAGFEAKLHTVYFGDNFDDVNNAAGGLPQGNTTYDPGTLKLAKTYYWRVDEFDTVDMYKGDVWSFATQGGVGSPEPSNGAVDIKQTPILTWTPGVFSASHEVYFGTDKDAVKNADTSSPEYKGSGNLGSESYEPGMLEWNTTYYWRIDDANKAYADSPWTGPLWSFTTANFLVVDDFESYYGPWTFELGASNWVFGTWIDGYDHPTNGSLVGYDTPPFTEQNIVHGGNHSMPLFYDNSVGYSEATADIVNLEIDRDWTIEGVVVLSLWFHGDPNNAPEPMYVALANADGSTVVVYHDNPDAVTINTWIEWTIDLLLFADQGVNLTNVDTISIGFGDKNNPQAGGGSGLVFFDDIRLYRSPPE
jgi:hypothetical protein